METATHCFLSCSKSKNSFEPCIHIYTAAKNIVEVILLRCVFFLNQVYSIVQVALRNAYEVLLGGLNFSV